MNTTVDYRKEIIKLTRDLPSGELKELFDFASFLKAKKEGFTYMQVKDSAEYVRKMRMQEVKRKTAKKFIEELIEWQKSDS